jgi:tRNA A-37 threonylcarbamoyl transferase component Bud32
MIQRLAELGVRVPTVLQRGQTQLLLSDLGPTLGLICKREPDRERRAELLKRGFEALLDLHARGAYVSQAVARNLTLDEHGVGFIDLEEDPLQMMPLAAAQARDALLWVQSSARFLADAPEQYACLLKEYLAAERDEVRAEILKTARRLRWLALPASLVGARGRAFSQALRHLADARS